MLADLRARNPGQRFARSASGATIAMWSGTRWVPCVAEILSPGAPAVQWARVPPGALDVCVNGVPLYPQEGWIE